MRSEIRPGAQFSTCSSRSPRQFRPWPNRSAVTLTAVAQHLQLLEEVRLVRTEKLGRVRTCRIETAGFQALEQWTRDHRTAWERKLDRLGAMLADEDAR